MPQSQDAVASAPQAPQLPHMTAARHKCCGYYSLRRPPTVSWLHSVRYACLQGLGCLCSWALRLVALDSHSRPTGAQGKCCHASRDVRCADVAEYLSRSSEYQQARPGSSHSPLPALGSTARGVEGSLVREHALTLAICGSLPVPFQFQFGHVALPTPHRLLRMHTDSARGRSRSLQARFETSSQPAAGRDVSVVFF